jgi:hypothetical protein
LEIKDYVVIQKPHPQTTRFPPPHTLIMDYTMTHIRFGRSHLHPMDQLTNTRRSDGTPDPDTVSKEVDRIKIRHYRNLYLNHPDPMDQLTNTRRSDGTPDPNTVSKEVDRIKIRHYRNLYLNHPDPIIYPMTS